MVTRNEVLPNLLSAAKQVSSPFNHSTERLETGQRKKFDAWAKEPRFVRTMTPTGKLTVGIEQEGYGETLVSERADSRLEDELDAVMAAVTLRHQRSVETRARWEQEERDREARRRTREEELRLEEEARRLAAAEAARQQALVLEAENWRTAEILRAYLSHLELRRAAGGQPADDYTAWRAWALAVADGLDGSTKRIHSGATS